VPLDPESLAELVVQTVDLAMVPILQRLSSAEASLTAIGSEDRLHAQLSKACAPMLERIVAAETIVANRPSPPDLSPVLERLAATEARVQAYTEIATKHHAPSSEPEVSDEDLSASLTGLLQKALDDLRPTATTTRKLIEKSANGFVVTEEHATTV
jgi:hypothetical protein